MMNFIQKGLVQQGYNNCSIQELQNISNGLRFTPLVCMMLALYGLYLQQPYLHFTLAALGIIPFWFPKYHPFDIFYNRVFRFLVGGMHLPPNPLPRRIACVMGGLMNIGIGISFLAESVISAYIFGGILITLQTVVITTHFCVASYLYEILLKAIGKWEPFFPLEETKKLLAQGALLVDVRTEYEYQKGHIDGAINIPLQEIENHKELQSKTVILYCHSGMRAITAKKKLNKLGNDKVYNLGSIERWK